MQKPEYPSVQGQSLPDLSLATYGAVDSRMTTNPGGDDCPPDWSLPTLQPCDFSLLGIDPGVPLFDLLLANAFPVPDPEQLDSAPPDAQINLPTGTRPTLDLPALHSDDLSGSGLDTRSLPDSLPYGLTLLAASASALNSDPAAPAFSTYDRPAGLLFSDPQDSDPALPADLSPAPHPATPASPEDRPGSLPADALPTLHADPTYQTLETRNPAELWMRQTRNNSRRERHLGRLELGLDQAKDDRS